MEGVGWRGEDIYVEQEEQERRETREEPRDSIDKGREGVDLTKLVRETSGYR